MMKMKKFLTILLLAALALFALTACREAEKPSGGDPLDTRFELVFESNGGTAVTGGKFDAGASIDRPAAPSKDYHNFDNWYSDRALNSLFDWKMPARNLTVYAKWTPVQSARIFFETDGGTELDWVSGVAGSESVPPAQPQKQGYAFGGWFSDRTFKTPYVFGYFPESDQTVYAKWIRDTKDYCFVTFVQNGVSSEVPVKKNTATEAPLVEAGRVTDWYTTSDFITRYDFAANVSTNLTLYALTYSDGLKIESGEIQGYTGINTAVILPERYDGTEVTVIGESSFYRNSSIRSVKIPDTVRSIGAYAFYGCEYLSEINVTDEITSIGKFVFHGCERLSSEVDLSGLTQIPENAFAGCKLLPGATFGNGLTSVEKFAFAKCESLTGVKLPETVERIFTYAFSGCGIDSFNIPERLSVLGEGVFKDCKQIREITISAGNQYFTIRGDNLYADNGATLVLYVASDDNLMMDSFRVPVNVTKISPFAFWKNSNIRELDVSKTNYRNGTYLGAKLQLGALQGMLSLEKLTAVSLDADSRFLAYWFGTESAQLNTSKSLFVPLTLKEVELTYTGDTTIPEYAFYGCSSLQSLKGFDSVATIEDSAFAYTGLSSFMIGKEVTAIGASVFDGCEHLSELMVEAENKAFAVHDGCLYDIKKTSLKVVPMDKKTIEFASTVTNIESNAFFMSGITDLVIPESVQTMEFGALGGVSALERLTVPFIGGSRDENNYMLYVFGAKITKGENNSINLDTLSAGPSALREITLTNPVSEIPWCAFIYLPHLRDVHNDKEIVSIGDYAFYHTGVEDVIIADSVERIGIYAYYDCPNLKEVRIGKKVSEVGDLAFGLCGSLETVVFEQGGQDLKIGVGAFLPKSEKVDDTTVYYSKLATLKLSDNIVSIGTSAFTYAGMNYNSTSKLYEETPLIVSFGQNARLRTVSKAAFAFACLSKLELPATVTSIGELAFAGCSQLETVSLGSSENESCIETIGGGAFAELPVLKSFTIHKSAASAAEVPVLEIYTDAQGAGSIKVFTPDISLKMKLFVPAGSVEVYREAWVDFKNYVFAIEERGTDHA